MRNLFLLAAVCAAAAASDLDTLVKAKIEGFDGSVSLYAKNLDSGATYSLRGEEPVRSASTIKLPILVEAFAAVTEGRVKWEDAVAIRSKVNGAGVLQELSDTVSLPLRDVVVLMIVVSDNTATNLVLDRLKGDAVNSRMDSLGLKQTRLLKKIGGGGESKAGQDPGNKRFGIGVTTPREMVTLLEKLERGQVVSENASREMVAILKRQQYKDGIGRRVPYEVASKSGALDALRSDVGIVYTPGGRIAIAATVDGMPKIDYSADNAGNILIAELTKVLVEGLAKGD